MAEVVIYTKGWCPYCIRAKGLLASLEVSFHEIDVEDDLGMYEEMVQRAGGRTSVPQIFIHDEHIGGCDDLHALHDKGKLLPKLNMSST